MTSEIRTQNPITEEFLHSYALFSQGQIKDSLCLARSTFLEWKQSSFADRAVLLKKVGKVLLEQKNSLALLMQSEMGKNLKEGVAEIEKCAASAEYYAENGAGFLKDMEVKTEAKKSYVCFEPLGTVFAIMPWNFPFWQVFRCALPAIMAGNTVLLKHASNVSGCALAIEEIFSSVYGKKGIFQTLIISGETALSLINSTEVCAVSFTGSTPVGKKIAGAAGNALKKSVLELGGSDAYVILEDADLPKAAQICAQSRLINAGQSCIAAKRFIVVNTVKKDFEKLLVKEMQKIEIAPMARADLREELHEQVLKSCKEGAALLCGGEKPGGTGFFYPSTVLTDVKPGFTAFREELFGPVASVIPAKNREEAILFANQTPFGLGAAVFTRSLEEGENIARNQLEAGSCFVNALVRSDPRLPFGGIKDSGYGRELSVFGMHEFVNVKTIYIGG